MANTIEDEDEDVQAYSWSLMRLTLPEGVYHLGFSGTFEGTYTNDVMMAVDVITQTNRRCEDLCKFSNFANTPSCDTALQYPPPTTPKCSFVTGQEVQ